MDSEKNEIPVPEKILQSVRFNILFYFLSLKNK